MSVSGENTDARYSKITETFQSLDSHLLHVANKAKSYATNFGFGDLAFLAGLLHDAGKGRLKGKNI